MFPSYSASGRQARGIRSLISAVNKHLGLCLLPISGNLSASQKKRKKRPNTWENCRLVLCRYGKFGAGDSLSIVSYRPAAYTAMSFDISRECRKMLNFFIRPPFRRTGRDNNNRIESLPRQRDLVRSPTFYCQFSRRWTFLLSNLKDTIRDGV